MCKNHLIYIFFISSFIFSACKAPKELEYKDLKNIRIEQIGASATAVKMDLAYYNPNNFSLQLKRTDLDIFIDGSFFGHSRQSTRITIPKRANFEIPLQIDVDMKNIFKNLFSSAFNKEVVIKVTGRVVVGKANVFKSFPVNYEGKQQFSLF